VDVRSVSLFWRLFVPNATVLLVAAVVLWVEPANGRPLTLAAGALLMLVVNWVLMRRTVKPLLRLASVMERVDPLEPGRRVEVDGAGGEVAVVAEAFNDMLDRVEFERRESGRRQLAAQQEERRRIARELHDEIGQSLTALSLHLDRIAAAPPAQRDGELAVAQRTASSLIEDVRSLAQSLRPDVLDNIGLASALANLLERLRAQTGLNVQWQLSRDLPPLHPDSELVCYRVAQEALNNAVRHAQASTIRLQLAPADGGVRLEVSDDGRGTPADVLGGRRAGNGIRFMRERALLVDARLSVRSRPGQGTQVTLSIPA
jgi:two-component system sensor histidine kinase UhpB